MMCLFLSSLQTRLLLSSIFLLICFLHQGVQGYKGGAPESRCDSMETGHWVSSQTIPSPFRIEVDSYQVEEEGRVQINLTTTDGFDGFKGFLIQVKRPEDDLLRNFGTFDVFRSDSFKAQGLNCFARENSAMTHRDSNEKRFVHLLWIAPKVYDYDVSIKEEVLEIHVTFVQNFYTFWTNQTPAKYLRVMKKEVKYPSVVYPTYSTETPEQMNATMSSHPHLLVPQLRDADSDFQDNAASSGPNAYKNLTGSWEYFKKSWINFLQYFGF